MSYYVSLCVFKYLAIQDSLVVTTNIISYVYIYIYIHKNIKSLMHTLQFCFWIDIPKWILLSFLYLLLYSFKIVPIQL